MIPHKWVYDYLSPHNREHWFKCEVCGETEWVGYRNERPDQFYKGGCKPAVNIPQPDPKPGDARETWELVIADMRERDAAGARKYGVRHQHDNGRDHLIDAYQEALDLVVYLRAEIEKRRAARAELETLFESERTP